MGLLKSFLGIKEDRKNNTQATSKIVTDYGNNVNVTINSDTPQDTKSTFKTKIQELIMIYSAEKFKVDENKYPDVLRSGYEIGFPNEVLRSLEKKGYIRRSTAAETLPNLKATELKKIASAYDLKVSGKKDDLCSRISESLDEEQISQHVSERYWKTTEQGKNLLNANPYIGFYLEKHEYDLNWIGLDIFKFAKLYNTPLNGTVRDRLWGEFNRLSIDYYTKGMNKGDFRDYCELLHIMALFLKEEKRFKDSLDQYMRYLHYRANFQVALEALQHYGLIGFVDNDAVVLTVGVEIMPYTAREIIAISEGCGFDSSQLRSYMLDAFSKEKDTGIFSPQELTELTMLGLNGDREGQKKICVNVMKAAMKKLPKKKR